MIPSTGPAMIPPPGIPPTPPRRRGHLVVVALVAMLAGLAGVVVGARLVGEGGSSPNRSGEATVASRQPLAVAPSGPAIEGSAAAVDIGALTTRLAPSVVSISTDIEDGAFAGSASGTGVVVTSDGEILTNAHVVAGASAIRVRLAGETEPLPATLLAADDGNDLALLRIDRRGLTPVTFASAESIAIGQEVVAIGFALDLDGEPTITRGIISATNRAIQTSSGILNSLIQTDAAISSGNSGGPLVNADGLVVGINTAVARGGANSQASNIGFAISSGEVVRVVDSLRRHAGGPDRLEGYLGVSLEARTDGGRGARVTEVQAGTPAARAGIRAGDIVVAVDGVTIDGTLGFIAAVRDREPGDTMVVTVLRDGVEQEITTDLDARPDS